MCAYHRVFVLGFQGDEFIQEAKKLINLRFGEIRVVSSVLNFESVNFCVLPANHVRQGAEAWITDGNPHRIAPVFLQQLNQHTLAVKAPLTPAPERYLVNIFDHGLSNRLKISLNSANKKLSHNAKTHSLVDASVYKPNR